MNNWLEFARALSPIFVAIVGALCVALKTYDRHLHRKTLLAATPEQREALEKMPVPSPLLDRGGALLLLLAAGLTLAALPRLVEDRAEHALRQRLQYAKRWSCFDCQELPPIGDFRTDGRGPGLPVYQVRN